MRRRIAQLSLTLATTGVVLGLYWYHSTHVAHTAYRLTETRRSVSAAVFIVLLLAAAYVLGLPDAVRRTKRAVSSAFFAPAATVAAVSIFQLAVGDAFLPRFVVFGALVVVPLANLAVTIPLVVSNQVDTTRAVVLASSDACEDLRSTLTRVVPSRLEMALILDVDAGVDKSLLTPAALDERAGGRVDVIVVADELLHQEGLAERLAVLHSTGIRFRTLLDFYEEWFRLVPLSELEDVSLLFDVSEVHSPTYVRLKRIFDVASAVGLLGLLALACPFVAIGNVIGNRGSFFFRQPRVGKGGEVFDILKLRTMNTGSEGSDQWTQANDPRVTPFGRWLRKLHIDELPQGFNILRGELSMVGPRPEQPQYVDHLRKVTPFYDARQIVRPGLTGWAQIALGYTADTAGARQKLQYELYYIRNQSIGFDIRIVIQTVRHSLRRGGH
jgi:lipopolysaccharide/colanic/teichoic acid biosynthesis glycosyltransferase